MAEKPDKEINELGNKIQNLKDTSSILHEVKEKDQSDDISPIRVGIDLMAGVGVGSGVGFVVDKWLDTFPIFFLICFIFGAVGGFYNIYRMAQNPKSTKK